MLGPGPLSFAYTMISFDWFSIMHTWNKSSVASSRSNRSVYYNVRFAPYVKKDVPSENNHFVDRKTYRWFLLQNDI